MSHKIEPGVYILDILLREIPRLYIVSLTHNYFWSKKFQGKLRVMRDMVKYLKGSINLCKFSVI